MSLYVFVTRRSDPLDDAGPEISAEEWRDLVRRDSSLKFVEPLPSGKYPEWTDKDTVICYDHPEYPEVFFDLASGNVEAKNADAKILRKLGQFAEALGARIESETGEVFNNNGESISRPRMG